MKQSSSTIAAIRRRYRAGYSIAVIARELRLSFEEVCWVLYGREVSNEIVFANQFHTGRGKASAARRK